MQKIALSEAVQVSQSFLDKSVISKKSSFFYVKEHKHRAIKIFSD